MTDWRDIVSMIETFSEVFHTRHARPEGSHLPPVPAAINPPQGKHSDAASRDSIWPSSPRSELRGSTEEKEADKARPGYTGELGSSRSDSHTVMSETPPTQWRDIWPK